MRTSRKRHWGFGLIEILVTLGVLSVGILGVTVLHSTVTKQSSENKSRAEALAIAQSRIEDMRNYTGDVSSLTQFNTLFATTSGFANSTSITGTNAAFTRTEQIAASGNLKALTVRVTWLDSDNVTQTVDLSSRISYVAPRSLGDTALEAATSVVDAPTGRAILGEGELPDDLAEDALIANLDGTSIYNADGDSMLVSDDQIVLTLVNACQTDDGTCTEFVRIRGRIYIDQASQSGLNPGEVYVIASDAAFCARHFTPDGDTEATPVTPATSDTLMTDGGDYEYFDYTCYIGGGWHGNIGVLLAGGLTNTDKICIGDPVTDDDYAKPVIASRRVYRGMLFKEDGDSTTYVYADDGSTQIFVESYTNSEGDPEARFYSQGIADGILMGTGDVDDPGHDFVIGSFQANKTEGQDCIDEGILTRDDSDADGDGINGDLFAEMPTDFVCLNAGFLDPYDAEYGNVSTCPYDPSDPPSSSHVVSGSLSFDADDTTENDVIAETIAMQTSDGPGNCGTVGPTHDGTYYQFTYSCTVYDWGNGWNGYIEADYDAAEMECDPYRLTKSALMDDSTGNDFTNCNTGSFAVITGTVTASGSRKLSTVTMGTDGTCTVPINGLSYECITTEYTGPTKTFSIVFTASSGVICKPTAPHTLIYTYTYTNQPAGNAAPLNLRIASNGNGC